MPTNKNASFRYRVLDECFQNRAVKWTIPKLVEKVSEELYEHLGIVKGIKERQLKEDISIMRSDPPRGYNAPIECKNGCYYYSDPAFSIRKIALNRQDIGHLNEALGLLKQFRGIPHFQDIERILVKLEGQIRYNDPEEEIISFEQIELIKGHEYIPTLYLAIQHQQAVTIRYLPFNLEDPLSWEVHPYYLKEYRGRWYVFGWVTPISKVTNLALDRIESIEACPSSYRYNSSFHPTRYFTPIVGVTLQEDLDPQQIKIKIMASSAPYVRTKLIHLSQQEIERTKEYSIFTFELIPNFEFEAELLRLGEAVEVLEPSAFREKIADRVLKASQPYKGF